MQSRTLVLVPPFVFVLAAMGCKKSECPDGYVVSDDEKECVLPDRDGDGWYNSLDCAPNDAAIYPGAAEICDGADNDCNGLIDDSDPGLVAGPGEGGATLFFADLDGDDAAGDNVTKLACEVPNGYAATATDCDDFDPAAYPGGTEVCDGADNDCNGYIDDASVCVGGHPGDLTLANAAAAQAFCADYDGTVMGSLTVQGPGFANLDDLACLSVVHGDLYIDTPLVDSIALPALQSVDGNIFMNLDMAASLSLPDLEMIGGMMELYWAPYLADVDLSSLKEAMGLAFYYLPAMEEIDLPALQNVGMLYFYYNESLVDIGLGGLQDFGAIDLYYNPMLASFDLSGVITAGNLYFDSNEALIEVLIPDATTVGVVGLWSNPAIQQLDLSAATSLGGLELYYNQDLDTVDFGGASTIAGDMVFYYNEDLDDPDFSALEEIGGDLVIRYQEEFAGHLDLSNIQTIGGDLMLSENGFQSVDVAALTSLGGLWLEYEYDLNALDLSNLSEPLSADFVLVYTYDLRDFEVPQLGDLEGDFVLMGSYIEDFDGSSLNSVGGDFYLQDYNTDIYNFSHLSSVGGNIGIFDNYYSSEMDFGGLQRVDGDLYFSYNYYVEELDLSSLEQVGGQLAFQENGSLNELDLSSLKTVGRDLRIQYMYNLDGLDLSALEFVGEDLSLYYLISVYDLAFPKLAEVGGTLYVSENYSDALALPSLVKANSIELYYLPALEELDFPLLQEVDDTMYLHDVGYYASSFALDAPALAELDYFYCDYCAYYAELVDFDFGGLERADGAMSFNSTGYYAHTVDISFPKLEHAGYLSFSNVGRYADVEVKAPVLVEVDGGMEAQFVSYNGSSTWDFPALERVGWLTFYYNGYYGYYGELHTDFSNLAVIDHDVNFYATGVRDFDKWGSLETVGGSVYLQENYNLDDITGLHGIGSVDYDVWVTYNNMGDTAAYAFVDSIGTIGGSSYVYGN